MGHVSAVVLVMIAFVVFVRLSERKAGAAVEALKPVLLWWAAIAILSLLMAVISPDKDKSAERDERSYDLDRFGCRW